MQRVAAGVLFLLGVALSACTPCTRNLHREAHTSLRGDGSNLRVENVSGLPSGIRTVQDWVENRLAVPADTRRSLVRSTIRLDAALKVQAWTGILSPAKASANARLTLEVTDRSGLLCSRELVVFHRETPFGPQNDSRSNATYTLECSFDVDHALVDPRARVWLTAVTNVEQGIAFELTGATAEVRAQALLTQLEEHHCPYREVIGPPG